ncbi:methyl-accepting chemotaxis protein [Aneurinibacillus terranovensis]|uniref:methyl-accepting chemotaxis protein n=1 Tax=Aneurinibacillus terranovensis TaxID=278991 RepID=UPI0003F96A4B|nr:methyl-accepting chemotaxis protein [Aneurinibacillus terranovensis]
MFTKINDLSIKVKLTVTILLITIIPLMVSGFLSYREANTAVYNMTVEDLKYITSIKSQQLEPLTQSSQVDQAVKDKIDKIVKDVQDHYYKPNGLGGYAYILNDKGQIVFHPDSSMIGQSLAQESFVKDIMSQKSGYITYPWKGEEKVASFVQLPNGWEFVIGSYYKDMTHSIAAIQTQMFIISLIAAVLSVVVGYFIVYAITRPIKELVAAMHKAEAGDVTVSVKQGSNDEIGQLTHIFNAMISEFRRLLTTVHQVSEQVAASSEELTASAHESTRASEQIAQASQEIASGTEAQMESVRNTSTSLHEMSGKIKEIADKIHAVKHDSHVAIQYAHDGEKSLEKVGWEMNDISEKVSQTEHQIRDLGNRSESIIGIISTIREISDQTNLLALNAAIEAARAGDQGKSFAVVAQEIRKLAEQSGRSASEIADLISDIHSKINTSVTSMSESSAAVSEGREVVEKAGGAFTSILKAIEDLNLQIEQVTMSAEIIAGGTARIVQQGDEISRLAAVASADTQEVAAASQEQTATMQEINAASEMLAKMAEELQQHVSRFKI